jgi:Tol biopolymer transport system component
MRRVACLVVAALVSGCAVGGRQEEARPPRQAAAAPELSGSIYFARTSGSGDSVMQVGARDRTTRSVLDLPRGHALIGFATSPSARRLLVVESIGSTGGHVVSLARLDGSRRRVLRRARPSSYYGVAWSPDETRAAFIRRSNDSYRLEIAQLDGSRRLLGPRGVDITSGLSWAPDGRRLAYGRDGSVRLFNSVTGADEPVVIEAKGARDPAWHPTEERLVVATRGGIGIVDLNSGSFRRLTTAPRSRFEDGPDNHPAWTPDGSAIAFAREGELFVVSAEGGEPRKLLGRPVQGPIAWRP